MKHRLFLYTGLLLALSNIAGCGGGGGGGGGGSAPAAVPNIPRFAYSANFNDGTISMYTVNAATGQLRHNGYVPAGTNPHAVAVHPSGRFVYVSNFGDGDRLSRYSVGADGRLTSIGTPDSGAGLKARGVTVDPTGKFLYLALEGAGAVSTYAINADGTLAFRGDDFSVPSPFSVTVDALGKYAYVTSFTDHTLSAFQIQANGTLTPIDTDAATAGNQPTIATGLNPHSASLDPSGKFAYVANFGSRDVSAYSVNSATGALAPVDADTSTAGIQDFPAGANPRAVTVDPVGRFVYVANFNSNDVSAYTINAATGALTPVDANPGTPAVDNFPAGTAPASVTVDPSRKFLYVANRDSNDVSTYAIDAATGALTALPLIAGRAGNLEMAMTRGTAPVKYTPKFAYVANLSSNNVSAHTINATTGALTAIGLPVAAGAGPVSVTVDPSGRFAYTANRGSNDVAAYGIGASGALTAIDADAATAGIQTTIPAGTRPLSVAVDPAGRFVYVANVGSGVADPGTVSAYTIDATTGALTRIDADAATLGIQDFAAGGGPDAVAVDPTGRFLYVANYGWPGFGTVSAYAINASTGALTRLDADPATPGIQDFVAGGGSDSVVVDPSGRFVYVTNLLADTVSAYAIDATTGALTRLDADPAAPGTQDLVVTDARPVSITVNPARRSVYIATACGNVWVFAINAAGVLARVDSAPGGLCGAFRDAPNTITVDTSGRFVYNVSYSSGDSISAYTIDATSGALTLVSGSPFAAGPFARSVATSGVIE